jgi:hypothetical protein
MGDKADEKSVQLAGFLYDETGWIEVFKEQARQHRAHWPAAPPFVNDSSDLFVVVNG